MRRTLRSALFLMAVITSWLTPAVRHDYLLANGWRQPAGNVQAFAKLERGMTPEQVREQLGAPKRIARQILSHRYLEQWSYDAPVTVRIHFDCPRGQKPQLVWKQMFPTEKGKPSRQANPR